MGGGASRIRDYEDDEDWDDVPVNKADLQTDGRVDMRHDKQALADQASFTTDYGRLSGQSKLAVDPYATQEADALQAQAAAHWHRIMQHTREQRLLAHENGEATPCPVCGQPTDDPNFCGFCGDIEEATRAQMESQELQMTKGKHDESHSSPSSSPGGSPGGRLFGSFLASTRSLLSGSGSGSGSGSPESTARKGSTQKLSLDSNGSPSARNSFRKSSNYQNERESFRRGRGSSLVDLDTEKEDMGKVLNTLLEGSLAARNRGKGSDGVGKSSSSLRQRLRELEQEEIDIAKREANQKAFEEERERQMQVRKFVGLGLDSESSSDEEDVDYETRQLKKKLKELKGAEESDDSEDDSETDGATAWERSPFFRLLNRNHKKDSKTSKGTKKKKEAAEYDSDDERADCETVGEPPYPPLPPLNIELKRRDATSIDLVWDVSVDMMQMLAAVRQAYGKKKSPIYQVMYRLHNANNSLPTGDSTKNGNSGTKPKTDEDIWKIGIARSKDFGGKVTNLQPNTSYQFRARRIGWCDKWNDAIPVVIRSGPGKPAPPRAVAAKEVSSESILLSWNVPEKDNGLPVIEYIVHMKRYGGEFSQVYQGKERCTLQTGLNHNMVHVFQLQAVNKVGKSAMSERLAVRTLPPGAAALSAWVEVVDERSHKVLFCHSKTNAVALKLPEGGILDEEGSFKNKRTYLLNQMSRRMQHLCQKYQVEQRPLQITVNRDNLLEDSLRILHQTPPIEIDQGPIRVRFQGEEGLDAGGLAKDWFIEVSRRLFDDSTGLLIVNDETGYVTIDPRATNIHSDAECTRLFRAIGTFIAKAIIDGQTLGIKLDPILLCHMIGKTPGMNTHISEAERECGEPQFYRGLKWVEDNDPEPADLTFTCSYELFDESHLVELIPLGSQAPVTNANKEQYVNVMTKWLLKDRYEPCLSSLLEGFAMHINISRYMNLFSISELELLIAGVPHIDVNELKINAKFGGFVSQSDQVVWLFELLEEFDNDKRAKFLQFISGCPCLPVDGLKPPLLVTLMEDIPSGADGTLPRSHTCFNQIVLPKYSSADILEKQLVYALENASEGFFIS
eukprot:GSChrysophyteH1.ASY1.ANO1.2744.1 assembled CDS